MENIPSPQQGTREVKEVIRYFLNYLKNPLFAIKTAPDWGWLEVVVVQFCVSLLFGIAADFFARNDLIIFKSTIFFPLSSFVTTFLGAGFFYFMLVIFFNTATDFLKLYLIVFLSHLPFLFLRLFKHWVAPIELLGFAATTALLTVGFVENFQLPKKKMIKIFGCLYALYLFIWGVQQIYHARSDINFKKSIQRQHIDSSESPDDIEKDFQQ